MGACITVILPVKKMMIDFNHRHYRFFDDISKKVGNSLCWWSENKDQMRKVTLCDLGSNYKKSIYLMKTNKKQNYDAVIELLKDYCIEKGIIFEL